MSKVQLHRSVIEEVENGPAGKHIGALFDLDKTLIAIFSAGSFMLARMRSGQMTRAELLANFTAMTNFIKGERDFSTMIETSVSALKGQPEEAFQELAAQIFEKTLSAAIYPEARALVEAHRRKGHTLAIISSATPYQIQHVARELGIEHMLCTRYEVKQGKFTGAVVQPTCWGEGKAYYGRQLAQAQGLDLEKSFFYTDSHEDLPLLQIVGRPRPLNPDTKLSKVAARQGWPIQHFSPSVNPGLRQIFRSTLLLPALVPTAMVGLPIRSLTGSSKRAADTAIRTWSELACAAIGVDVVIHGREHLWSQRPCVFIYNHQSSADALIVFRVLERDFVGIAKKEIANVPFFGTAAKAMGTVFIDRSDKSASGARSGLEPAVDALRKGQSIVVAPEGTRSYSYKLGPFKKGAFHIAMQAGVPIVPFVVHNSIDIAPKGSKLYRSATVEVEVLPPISTRDWRLADMDRHVAEVRGMFLDRLGQSQEVVDDGQKKAMPGTKKPARTTPKTTGKPGKKTRPVSKKRVAPKKNAATELKPRPKTKLPVVKRAASGAKPRRKK